jgi:ribonuclease VapC
MIVDSSAIVAIFRGEDDAGSFTDAMETAPTLRMSAATFLECSIVLDAVRNPVLSRKLDGLLATTGMSIEPVSEKQAHIAREAYRDFGKGSGHPAKLNFGDCFSYALAKDYDEPLLCKGNDFRQTDLRCVP